MAPRRDKSKDARPARTARKRTLTSAHLAWKIRGSCRPPSTRQRCKANRASARGSDEPCAAGHRITGDRHGASDGAGYDFVHVAVDDATRLAYVEVLSDEKRTATTGFLVRALRWFRQRGIKVERIMTDNGSGYIARLFAKACRWLAIRHIRTRPYTPKTNGKAERFIQTLLREWAYGHAYLNSDQRRAALPQRECHSSITLVRTELVTTLKRQATELLADLERDREPILITQHGLPSAYLVDVETYERLQERLAVLEGIARGEIAVVEGRVMTHADARKRMARWLR